GKNVLNPCIKAGYYSNASYPHPPPHSLMPTLQPHPPGSSMPTQTVSYRIGSPQQSVGQSVAQQTIAQAVQSVVAENTSQQQAIPRNPTNVPEGTKANSGGSSFVYSQVQVLFKNAPDLLDEFKQFLPDTSGNVASGGLFGPIPQNHGTPKQSHLLPAISAIANSGSGHGAARLPSVGNFSSQSD
ncbi:10578_t:CDS:2, partial [Gigaspora rosea]